MSKLYRARSLLYRRQILQENVRWKALDEIYKIYMLLHRTDLKNSATIRPKVFSKFANLSVLVELFSDPLFFCAEFNLLVLSTQFFARFCF